MDDITAITAIIQDVGVWALFAWLYLREHNLNRELNEQYRNDLRNQMILRGGGNPFNNPPTPPSDTTVIN